MLTKWAEATESLSSSSVDARSPTSQNLATFARLQVADLTNATQREREKLYNQREDALQEGKIGIAQAVDRDRHRRISFGLGISTSNSSVHNLAAFANAPKRPGLERSPSAPDSIAPVPQRRREGFLFASSKPTSNKVDGNSSGSMQRFWVVLSQGQLIEYKHATTEGPMTASSPPINLKYACVKDSASSERRFTCSSRFLLIHRGSSARYS